MATLKEIHDEELKMLSFLDQICRKENVRYSMIGGTMLGAVRHKGFIPWDDDIDVFMKVDDFEKIKSAFKSDEYFLQIPETDIEMPFAMYKIRRNNSTMFEPGMESLNMHHGVWIDIFLYTDAGKTDFSKNIQKYLFKVIQTYRCRYLNRNTDESRKIHKLLTKLPHKLQLLIDKSIIGLICLIGSKKSDEYFALDVGKHCVYPKKYYDEQACYPFEGYSFYGPKDYDGFLTMVFGPDYMVPNKWAHIPDFSDVVIE